MDDITKSFVFGLEVLASNSGDQNLLERNHSMLHSVPISKFKSEDSLNSLNFWGYSANNKLRSVERQVYQLVSDCVPNYKEVDRRVSHFIKNKQISEAEYELEKIHEAFRKSDCKISLKEYHFCLLDLRWHFCLKLFIE